MVRDFGISGISRVTFGSQLSYERYASNNDTYELLSNSLEIVQQALKHQYFKQTEPKVQVMADYVIGQKLRGPTRELIADYQFEPDCLVCTPRTVVNIRAKLWRLPSQLPHSDRLTITTVAVEIPYSPNRPYEDANKPKEPIEEGVVEVGYLTNNEFRTGR